MFIKTNISILRVMILLIILHKCMLIVMQIGPTISITAYSHWVMFSYWVMDLLVEITRNNLTLQCHQHKLSIWQILKQQNKECDFNHYLKLWWTINETHWYIWWQSTLHIFIRNLTFHACIQHITIHHHLAWKKIKDDFIKSIYYNIENMVVSIFDLNIFYC